MKMICAYNSLSLLGSTDRAVDGRTSRLIEVDLTHDQHTRSSTREGRSRCLHAMTKRVDARSNGISDDQLCVSGITQPIRRRQQSDCSAQAKEHGCLAVDVHLQYLLQRLVKRRRRTPSMSALDAISRTLGYGLGAQGICTI